MEIHLIESFICTQFSSDKSEMKGNVGNNELEYQLAPASRHHYSMAGP